MGGKEPSIGIEAQEIQARLISRSPALPAGERRVMTSSTPIGLIQFRAAYNLPVHAGIEHGIFEAHGLSVDFEYTPGSSYLMEAVRAGRTTIGHAAMDDVVADVENHADSQVFAFIGLHSGLLSLVGAPNFPDLKSLRGKHLAVDDRHSGFVFVLEKALRDAGFRHEDYTLVEVGGWEKRYSALIDGTVCATLLTAPFLDYALERGCHLLLRGDEMMAVYQATVGVARRSWARANAEQLLAYIRAYVAATRWCFDPRHREHCLDLLVKHNGLTPTVARETLTALLDRRNGLYPEAKLNVPGIAAALDLRAEMGFLERPLPPVDKYIDTSYYQRAMN